MRLLSPPSAWQRGEERALIIFLLLALLAGPWLLGWSGLRREALLRKIPATESNAPFLIRELYHDPSPIDLVFVGPCTVWWQIETRLIQERLSLAWGRPAKVISLGFNHFGSDVEYLILRDLLERRAVRNVALALPKREDFKAFPHQNAIAWWIYPRDLEGVEGLSVNAHARLFALSAFSAVSRVFLRASIPPPVLVDAGGFRADRQIDPKQGSITSFPSGGLVRTDRLRAVAGPAADVDPDWWTMSAATARLLRKKGVPVFFVDSPHASDFEGEKITTAWGFEPHFDQDTRVILTDFRGWQERLPPDERSRLVQGDNLTPVAAHAYTKLIADAVVQEVRP